MSENLPDSNLTNRELKSVCVYCASSPGANLAITEAAVELGQLLADQGMELVYGGASVGLMGLIADTVMANGGTVTGYLPTGLFPDSVGHSGITRLVEVGSMHERKQAMFDHADAFIAMPGGFGTIEELAEVITWAQIGLHNKPIGVLNVDGFWDPFLAQLDRAISDRVLKEQNRKLVIDAGDGAALLAALQRAEVSFEPKWLDRGDGGA